MADKKKISRASVQRKIEAGQDLTPDEERLAWGISTSDYNQLFGQPVASGTPGEATKQIDIQGSQAQQNKDLAIQNQSSLLRGNTTPFEQDVFTRQYASSGGNTLQSDPSKYYMGGDQNFAIDEHQRLQDLAAQAQLRQGPTIDQAGVSPWQSAAAASGRSAYGVAQGPVLASQASAAGLQLGAGAQQMGVGAQLQGLAQQPAGPSVAELSMRVQEGRALQQQAALAAGARGGGSALAAQNAAANAGAMSGQLGMNLGIQRAQEDMANRQFAAGTLGQAAGVYGAAAGTYGGAGAQYGNIAGTQLGAYGQAGQIAGQGAALQGGFATQNASNVLGQQQLNNAYSLGLQGQGQDLLKSQLAASAQYDTGRTNRAADIATGQYANRDRSGEGTITGSGGGDKALSAGLQAAGTAAVMMSDVRAKKDIVPADAQISQAFRTAGRSVGEINNASPQYPMPVMGMSHAAPPPMAAFPDAPGYGFDYRNAAAPGAAAGRHYGPMAQDLESTPAGASVVGEDAKGHKFVDPGRLAMLNAAETARQRREIDALKAQAVAIRTPQVAYPAPTVGAFGY